MFRIITWSISIIIAIQSASATNTTYDDVSALRIQEKNSDSPFLFHYDKETRHCERLLSNLDTSVMCANDRILLRYTFCLTYNEQTSVVSVSRCPYFELSGHNTSVPGFISLSENISELNDSMCGPMKRTGIVCSKCIDGYGPSVTSPNFRCSDCSNAWYGIPLYLLLELAPVTIFYLIMLIFQVNITSAPMISFIFYSNAVLHALNFNILANQDQSPAYGIFLTLSYGVWSLDFFRYVVPPFCVSPHIKIIHALYLQNISTVFPFVLTALTWLCIELYSRDYKVVTVPWQLLNRVIFKRINTKWDSGRTVADTFATFFLLSFSKVTFVLLVPLYSLMLHNLNITDLSPSVTRHPYTDLSIEFISKEHLPFVAVSILLFLFTILPPVLLLVLYPFHRFRSLLFKCLPKRSRGPLNIFMEKFHSCYRDGLDGGKDMRSIAALYFFVLLVSYISRSINGTNLFPLTTLYAVCSLFIANVQPYKKKYMSVIDSLIFATLALLTAALDRNIYASSSFALLTKILSLIPALGLFSFVVYKLMKKQLKMLFSLIEQKLPASVKQKLQQVKQSQLACCNGHKDDRTQDEEQGKNNHHEAQLPDRVVHPELYEAHENQQNFISSCEYYSI